MFPRLLLGDLVKLTKSASSTSSPQNEVTAISTDSRTLKPGDVFAAIPGESFDGHDYLEEAAIKGAVAAIVERKSSAKIEQIVVKSTLMALVNIAESIRDQFKGPVFAVTGSAGKSSTKDMIRVLLGEDETLASPASFNNLLGVSKTLFLLRPKTKFLVLEMGMNAKGEIKELCEHFKPMGGCITNIGDAHIGKLGGIEGVYSAKKELFDYLSRLTAPGVALNVDDPLVNRALKESFKTPPTALTYSSKGNEADLRVLEKSIDPESGHLFIKLALKKETIQVSVPIFGDHQAQNIAGSSAAALLLGISGEDIKTRLLKVRPARHRGEIGKFADDCVLIDESYNSNPTALESSLATLFAWNPPNRRRVLVIGEMKELGDFSESLHGKLGKSLASYLEKSKVPAVVVGVGAAMKPFLAPITKGAAVFHTENWKEAFEKVREHLRPRDILFVKGSRGNSLDLLVEKSLALTK